MKTLVLGASENVSRYSNRAIHSLLKHGYEVVAIGARPGKVEEVIIKTGTPQMDNVDTVTIYLNRLNQIPYYDFILSLRPRRIIFNPGAENEELELKARDHGVLTENACSLVLLETEQY